MDKYTAIEIIKLCENLSSYDRHYTLKVKALEQAWITLAAQGNTGPRPILNPKTWSKSFGS